MESSSRIQCNFYSSYIDPIMYVWHHTSWYIISQGLVHPWITPKIVLLESLFLRFNFKDGIDVYYIQQMSRLSLLSTFDLIQPFITFTFRKVEVLLSIIWMCNYHLCILSLITFERLHIGITCAVILTFRELLDIPISTIIMTLYVYIAAPVEAFSHTTWTKHVGLLIHLAKHLKLLL